MEGDTRKAYRILAENLKQRDHLQDHVIGGRENNVKIDQE
jgi:hypothetical protein